MLFQAVMKLLSRSKFSLLRKWSIKFVLYERTFKMIYKLPLQIFRILLGFRNKSTYFDQKQRAFRYLGYAFDIHSSQVE
jgi:hypothetical protein